MADLQYLDYQISELVDSPLWWHLKGLSYTATGYGGKIPSAWKIRHEGRMKRVYIMIYSNIGTAYILSHGERLILRDI